MFYHHLEVSAKHSATLQLMNDDYLQTYVDDCLKSRVLRPWVDELEQQRVTELTKRSKCQRSNQICVPPIEIAMFSSLPQDAGLWPVVWR